MSIVKLLMSLLINGFAVFVTDYILGGVEVDSFMTVVIVGVVLGILNTILKPILVILTLPITIVTLGLFMFVLNAALVWLVATVVPGFTVDNFISAILFSLLLSLVNSFFNAIAK